MKNNIVEADQPMGTAAAVIEKKARQLVYDARYEVKGALGGKKVDAATLERMIMDRIRKSSSIPAVKTRAAQMVSKKPTVKETYIPEIKDAAATSVANALFKVFVEGIDPVIPDYLEELHGLDDKKYKVRVTDLKTGNSYVRYATREKITQLRSQGLKVEMTEYGEPREGEKKRGEDTARATGGGTAKKDYDGDGKVESGAKEYRGAVHNAIQRNKGGKPDGQDTSSVKEEFLADGTESTEGRGSKVIGKNVDNYKNGVITISPKDGSQADVKPQSPRGIFAHTELEGDVLLETGYSKFLKKVQDLEEMSVSINQQQAAGAALSAKRGKTDPSQLKGASREMYDSMTEKQLRDFAKTKHKGLPEKVEEECGSDENPKMNKNKTDKEVDPRSIPTKLNLVKNKLRAMGAKNPIVMMASEETVEEGRALGRAGRDDDDNPRGAAVRASSGRGMTMTPARGLGASKPEGDDKKRAKRQSNQAREDRRSAAKDRASEGEDRLSRLIRSVQNNSYNPEGEQIDEVAGALLKLAGAGLGMYAAGKGMEALKGKVDKKIDTLRKTSPIGGDRRVPQMNSYEPEGEILDERTRERKGQPRPARDRAMEFVRQMPNARAGLMTRSGQTIAQHQEKRGVKKQPGAPTPQGETTADRLAAKKRRAAAAEAAVQRARAEEDRRRRLA